MTLASPFSNALHSPAWGTRSATIGESVPSQGLCSSGPYFLILCLSIHSPSIRASIHPPALPPLIPHLPIQPSIHSCVPTHLSVGSFVCLHVSACLSNHPSICPSSCTADIQHDCSGPGSAGHWGCTERQVPGPKETGFSGRVSSGLSCPLERRVQLSRSSLERYTATSQSAPCTWALCSRHSHKSGFSAAERELCM